MTDKVKHKSKQHDKDINFLYKMGEGNKINYTKMAEISLFKLKSLTKEIKCRSSIHDMQ